MPLQCVSAWNSVPRVELAFGMSDAPQVRLGITAKDAT